MNCRAPRRTQPGSCCYTLIPVELIDAVTTAAAAVLVLLHGTASAAYVITLATKIAGVAGGTERRIARERIGYRTGDGTAVAGAAPRVSSVITRVVTAGTVAEDVRRPGIGRMAHIALFCRAQVARRLAGRCAAVVTGIALTRRAGVMEPGAADERRGGVAEMAVQRGCNMGIMLAGRGHPVAGRAVVDDTGVIEYRTDESTGVMADTAVLVGRNMANRFSDREYVIVA